MLTREFEANNDNQVLEPRKNLKKVKPLVFCLSETGVGQELSDLKPAGENVRLCVRLEYIKQPVESGIPSPCGRGSSIS